jgi:hypothetical protein
MELQKSMKDKLILDHLKLISSILSDGIIIPAKTVRANASSAAVYLPRKYVGYTFKIILLPETEADKALFKKQNALIEKDKKISQMTKQMKALQTRIGKLQTKKEVLVNPVSNTETSGEPEDAY